MRVTLTALRAGAAMGSEETDDCLVVQVLRGDVDLRVGDVDRRVVAGQLASIERPVSWQLLADTDALLLLTVVIGTPRVAG